MLLKVHADPNNPDVRHISFADTEAGIGVVRDFTKNLAEPWKYTRANTTEHHKRIMEPARWANFKKNKTKLDKSTPFLNLVADRIGTVMEKRTLIICGNGYSLKEHAHLLKDTKADILALNGAIDVVPRADYFMAIDWTPNLKFASNHYDTKAVLSVTTHPNNVRPFKNRYFVCDNRDSKIDNKIRAVRPDIFGIDVNLEVGFSALHFAWLLQYQTVITIGFEHCYANPQKIHATGDFTDQKKVFVVEMDDGRKVYSNFHLMLGAQTIKGGFYFLRENGVRVIECSDGLIDEQCEQMKLEDALLEADSPLILNEEKVDIKDLQ